MQRVCRYPLLLRELQQATSPDCTDWADLKVAQERFNSVIGQINEMRRETENHLRQQQLADSMRSVPPDLDLCADGRHLLREATVAVMADGSKWRPHVLYMFTDCVVYATEAILGGHTFRGVAWFALALLNERPTADWAPKGEEGVVELVLVDKKKTMVERVLHPLSDLRKHSHFTSCSSFPAPRHTKSGRGTWRRASRIIWRAPRSSTSRSAWRRCSWWIRATTRHARPRQSCP